MCLPLPDGQAKAQAAAPNTAQHAVKAAPVTPQAVQATGELRVMQPLQPPKGALATADMPLADAGKAMVKLAHQDK